jgi:hypothetical protein
MKALPFHLIVLALFKNSHGDISANYDIKDTYLLKDRQ